MSYLQGQAPSGEAQGSEGNKSSVYYSSADHRQELNKSYYRCANDLQDWFIAKGYYKLLQINPEQLYKERLAFVMRRNNPFNLPLTEDFIFKCINTAHFKTKRTIQSLYEQIEQNNLGGDL